MCLCLQTESYLISIGTYEILNETEENDSLNGNLSTGNDTLKGDICFYIVKLLFVKYHKQYVKKLVNDLKEISNMIILKFNWKQTQSAIFFHIQCIYLSSLVLLKEIEDGRLSVVYFSFYKILIAMFL